MSAAAEIKRLNREADRIARLLARAENRANDGAGVYSESQARADARHRRSQATIRKHRAALARIDRRIAALTETHQGDTP